MRCAREWIDIIKRFAFAMMATSEVLASVAVAVSPEAAAEAEATKNRANEFFSRAWPPACPVPPPPPLPFWP
jgi:hypothetical protein